MKIMKITNNKFSKFFKSTKKKLVLKEKPKPKNPIKEYNPAILVPELLLGKGGSLQKCIDYVNAKLQEYITTNDIMIRYFGIPLAQESSLYKKEKHISPKKLKKILNSQ